MNIRKSTVKKNNQFDIHCLHCLRVYSVSIDELEESSRIFKIKGTAALYVYKCQCNAVFNVQLDFRKIFRRDSELSGFYCELTKNNFETRKTLSDHSEYRLVFNCTIKNISADGIGINTYGKHNIKIGDRLLLIFMLDNGSQSLIEKKVMVRVIHNNYVGCEFYPTDKNDAKIGFYIR